MRDFRLAPAVASTSFILVIFLLGLSPVLPAAEPPPDQEQRWHHLKDLQEQLSKNAPKGVNEIEFFAPVKAELHTDAADFAAAYPHDPRRWEAKLLEIKTTNFPTPPAERQSLFDKNEKIVGEIEAAADAPREIKENAERTILFQHLDHLDLVDSPQQASALEKRMVAFLHDYPDDPRGSSMQVRRADLLARSDPAKVRPLLDELSASDNPKVAAAARGRIAQIALGKAPLDWKFTALDGREIDFDQMRGRVILIDYWASWCPDCLRALPQVLAVYRKYHDQGFEVVGISLDNDQDALVAFLKKHDMPWPEYFDGKGWQSDLVTRYGVGGIPEMWIVDRDGRVSAAGVQPEEIDGMVAGLLGR